MGAAGLIDIKRRLKSVQSTKKITNAMGLVATSKLRKCRKELANNSSFYQEIDNTMQLLIPVVKRDYNMPCLFGNESDRKLYIVITSDSGLCGGYNNNVTTYLQESIKDFTDKADVILVGIKGMPYVKKYGLNIIEKYTDIPDIPTLKEIKDICENFTKIFNEGKASEVNIVYTKFISPIKQTVLIEKLLPLEEKQIENASDPTVDGEIPEIMEDALDVYVKGKFLSFLLSSKCSEQSSRMTAMDGATSNANELIKALNLSFNRIRQAVITQEISEIVGGAEAQK